jgi:hypothetical protein
MPLSLCLSKTGFCLNTNIPSKAGPKTNKKINKNTPKTPDEESMSTSLCNYYCYFLFLLFISGFEICSLELVDGSLIFNGGWHIFSPSHT